MADFKLSDSEKIVSAQFPAGMEGSDVHYTIYNQDQTVAVARTNSGVIDYGKGFFEVDVGSLLTSIGEYVIIFDIDSKRFAPERIRIRKSEIEQRDFQEFNAAKNPTKVIIKKTRTDSFNDAHETVELDLEYNNDNTPKKMEEKRL